jgi:hypothetical protein
MSNHLAGTTKKAKVRVRGMPANHDTYHVAEIAEWRWDYAMAACPPNESYSKGVLEGDHLKLRGPILTRHFRTAKRMHFTLLPDPETSERSKWTREEAKALSLVGIYKGTADASIGFPDDRLAPILTALGNGHLKYVIFATRPVGRLHEYYLRSWRLTSEYDPAEYG